MHAETPIPSTDRDGIVSDAFLDVVCPEAITYPFEEKAGEDNAGTGNANLPKVADAVREFFKMFKVGSVHCNKANEKEQKKTKTKKSC